MKSARETAVITVFSAILLAACGNSGAGGTATAEKAAAPSLAGWGDASADFVNAAGDKTGEVAFKATPHGGVLVRISLSGLPEGWHGIHLHQVGDCSDGADGFKASGGHIDPGNMEHGLLNPNGPEAADMPNIYASANGVAAAEILNDELSLDGGSPLADADGFAVVVHESPDDGVTQPIGGAGARLACAAVSLGE